MEKIRRMDEDELFLINLVTPTILRNDIVPLYNLRAAKKVIEACHLNGVGILGIDGFYLKGDALHDAMYFNVDFSYAYKKVDFVNESIEGANRFLLLVEENSTILFEFVLGPLKNN
jgi:hypothetical protein